LALPLPLGRRVYPPRVTRRGQRSRYRVRPVASFLTRLGPTTPDDLGAHFFLLECGKRNPIFLLKSKSPIISPRLLSRVILRPPSLLAFHLSRFGAVRIISLPQRNLLSTLSLMRCVLCRVFKLFFRRKDPLSFLHTLPPVFVYELLFHLGYFCFCPIVCIPFSPLPLEVSSRR